MSAADSSAASSSPPAAASSSEKRSADLTGQMLGEFHLLRRLGRGGMADVYLAEQTSLRRQVAVKVLRSEFTTDAGYLKRFQQEASAAGTMTHPNIVQVYLIGQHESIHFIAQEYVQGRNLKEFLSRKGPLDLPVALVILRQVAAALQVAGAAGVVHRDIKPENILLTRKGEAKVADFGLAQLTLQGERVALTQVGITMGTPLYMSPEQVNGKPLDSRSDLYSFGVMAYQMLSGKPPFDGDTPLAIAVQHLNSQCVPLENLRPDLPKPICDFVRKLMSKKREDRYPDAQAVLQELKQLSKQVSDKEPDNETSTEVLQNASAPSIRVKLKTPIFGETRLDHSWRKHLLWLIPLCLVTAGLAAGAGWAMRIGNPLETPPAQQTGVPNMGSADAQFYYATGRSWDEAAWAAVLQYYGDDPHAKVYCNRAELRLALIDLGQEGRVAEAERKFYDMLNEGEALRDSWKSVHGRAGLALVAARQKRYDDVRNRLREVEKEKLDDAMLKAVNEMLDRNRGAS